MRRYGGVLGGVFWTTEVAGETRIVGDFVTEDRVVMAISVTGPDVTEGRVLELLDTSLSRLIEFHGNLED